jgi:hypothetical protein
MGCHTRFSKPLTEEEYGWLKEWAVNDAEELFGLNNPFGSVYADLQLVEYVKESVNSGQPARNGKMWYEYVGLGSNNPKFIEKYGMAPKIREINGYKGWHKLFIDLAFNVGVIPKKYPGFTVNSFYESGIGNNLYFPYFHDEFRIADTYPRKVIHNKKELRRFLGEDYFRLSIHQSKRIFMFFRLYPGGVITFG